MPPISKRIYKVTHYRSKMVRLLKRKRVVEPLICIQIADEQVACACIGVLGVHQASRIISHTHTHYELDNPDGYKYEVEFCGSGCGVLLPSYYSFEEITVCQDELLQDYFMTLVHQIDISQVSGVLAQEYFNLAEESLNPMEDRSICLVLDSFTLMRGIHPGSQQTVIRSQIDWLRKKKEKADSGESMSQA